MSRAIQKGATDRSVIMRAIDSTDGTPETGFAYNTSGIDLWYRREGGSVVSITEATLSAVDSAHSDGGVIHIRDGYFRLDAPDAAFATGANSVMFGGTATGMIIIGTEIQLVNYNPEDGVRLGLTALPNAAADAAGGLPISDAGALDLDTLLTRLDAAISTRLASANYTAPNNSGITDIKAKTDQLTFTTANKVDATATVSGSGLATEAKQDEIISDIAGVITHGDANWLTPSGIGGTIAITFNVKDDSGNNILDAVVEVWDTAGTTLKERKETNSSGNAVFNCKAESYTIKITKSGYSFDNASYTVTVPATVNYVMTAFNIPVSPDLTKCRVWMKLINTYASLTVTADVPENLTGNNLVMGNYTGVYDTVNNLVYWDLPIGALNSVLKITELGFEVVVPLILDLESSELKDLI